MRRSSIYRALLWSSLWLSTARAGTSAGPAPDPVARAAPFTAFVAANSTRVHREPDARSLEVGALRRGASVVVSGCVPDCSARTGWALLGDGGAVSLSAFRATPDSAQRPPSPPPEGLDYGRVGRAGIAIYREPRTGARLYSHLKMPRDLAFLPDAKLLAGGWLERVEGGFVRSSRVAMLTPSTLRGEPAPQLPLAFVTRELQAVEQLPLPAAPGERERLHRYDRVHVLQLDGEHVLTAQGLLPRAAVRIAEGRTRPSSIPADARWVHLDLAEQTLTAYEGDRAVYAALVSTGKGRANATHAGVFQIEHKLLYSDMHGEPAEPYTVDRVPYALYYNGNEAIHGTYWHDRFGATTSHGCVNLPLADASWLFQWAPPLLPAGWSEVEGKSAGHPALWISIEDGRKPARPAIARPEGVALYAATRAPRGAASATAALTLAASTSPAWQDLTSALIIPVVGVKAGQLVDTYSVARSNGRTHNALDIPAPRNTPVVAAIAGTILKLFQSERGGTTVNQLGADGATVFYYAHLDRYAAGLKEGQTVRQGTVIGYVGDTGNAGKGNTHLHFAIWHLQGLDRYWEGTNVNPYPLLARRAR